jgi:hypothetical protein
MQRVVVVKHENLIDILLQATFMVNFRSHGEVKIIICVSRSKSASLSCESEFSGRGAIEA